MFENSLGVFLSQRTHLVLVCRVTWLQFGILFVQAPQNSQMFGAFPQGNKYNIPQSNKLITKKKKKKSTIILHSGYKNSRELNFFSISFFNKCHNIFSNIEMAGFPGHIQRFLVLTSHPVPSITDLWYIPLLHLHWVPGFVLISGILSPKSFWSHRLYQTGVYFQDTCGSLFNLASLRESTGAKTHICFIPTPQETCINLSFKTTHIS